MGLGIFYSAFEGVRYSSSVGIIISDPTPGQDPQRFNQGLDDATAVLQAIKKEIDDYGACPISQGRFRISSTRAI